jgi:MYXO-CTERM domain-containing protein
MGGGCRHMNAWQKDYQGWFGGCNGVNVTASGTFTLLPIEQRCDGVQFLKIPAPKVRSFNRPAAGGGGATVETFSHYYVELRTGQDFDGTLGNRTALAPQVLVHIGGDRRTRTQRGLHTFLLDMTPTTTGTTGRQDSALAAGKSFSDPAGGMTITVQSASMASATITVDVAAGTGGPTSTCLDASPFTAPGPGQESCSTQVPTGAAGTGGTVTGAAGTGGVVTGAAGTGGVVTGAAGRAGTAGTGGAAGRVGSAGTGGPVMTGTAGTGPSSTGAGGTTGAGGGEPPGMGAAGTGAGLPGGAAGTGMGPAGPGEVTGHGCACDTSGGPGSPAGLAAAALLGAIALARGRRHQSGARARRKALPKRV